VKKLAGMVLGLAVLAAGPVWAQQSQTPLGAIKKMQQLPITGVNIVESDKGTFFVSANGRFVFKGPIFDMWNGQPISTMEEVEKIVNRLDLKKIGVDLDGLSTFTLGKGPREVVVFASPECPHCHQVLQQAAGLTEQFTFRIVVFPVSQKALPIAKKVWCAGPEKGLPALLAQKYDGLPEGQCDIAPMQKTLVVARVLSIPAVPFLIRDDGQTHKGALNDLAGWLAGQPIKEAKK